MSFLILNSLPHTEQHQFPLSDLYIMDRTCSSIVLDTSKHKINCISLEWVSGADVPLQSIFRFHNKTTVIATISRVIRNMRRVNMSSQVSFISEVLATH